MGDEPAEPNGWEVNDEEFTAVTALPADRRYAYFVKRAAGYGGLWGLRSPTGWAVSAGEDGDPHIPVWPHPRFAQACAEGPWEDARPCACGRR